MQQPKYRVGTILYQRGGVKVSIIIPLFTEESATALSLLSLSL